MGRTGDRSKALVGLLVAQELVPVKPPSVTRLADLPDAVVTELRQLFVLMGGEESMFSRCRPGGWDMAFGNDLVVELDEQQHFNRYRGQTLDCSWSGSQSWQKSYMEFCARTEDQCLRYGKGQGRWTSRSAERFFGVGAEPGDFTGVGSARWRQRAFYDAIKDAIPGVRLARVSVHDPVGDTNLEQVLRTNDLSRAREVLDLVIARATT